MKHIAQILGPIVRHVKREAGFRFGGNPLRADPSMDEILMVEGTRPVTFGEANERFARSYQPRPPVQGPMLDITEALAPRGPAKK